MAFLAKHWLQCNRLFVRMIYVAKQAVKQIPNETKQGRKLSFVTECLQILADFTETHKKKSRLGHGKGLKMTVHET